MIIQINNKCQNFINDSSGYAEWGWEIFFFFFFFFFFSSLKRSDWRHFTILFFLLFFDTTYTAFLLPCSFFCLEWRKLLRLLRLLSHLDWSVQRAYRPKPLLVNRWLVVVQAIQTKQQQYFCRNCVNDWKDWRSKRNHHDDWWKINKKI